jgi:8-oxo-dGTP pyrophosphatase MutT (NUDIX family)
VIPQSLDRLATQLQPPLSQELAGRDQAAAVLVLLSADLEPTVLLTLRASALRHHGGQVSFPGGGIEGAETALAAALREAEEEAGVDPDRVHFLGELPPERIEISRFAIRVIVGWWSGGAGLRPNPGEVEEVIAPRLTQLADPAARFTWRHPRGLTGPGFLHQDLFIWGFTAGVLNRILSLGGWEQPWDQTALRAIPSRFLPAIG